MYEGLIKICTICAICSVACIVVTRLLSAIRETGEIEWDFDFDTPSSELDDQAENTLGNGLAV